MSEQNVLKFNKACGWIENIRHLASPNFNLRPSKEEVNLLVIHNISLPAGQFGRPYIDQLFSNQLEIGVHPSFTELEHLRVSSHFMINRQGLITQYVSTHNRAWHAGKSSFKGRTNCNDYSIGIELEGTDDIAYTDAQYLNLNTLTTCLCQHYSKLSKRRITGHSDIAPGRKTDPGSVFDWPRFLDNL